MRVNDIVYGQVEFTESIFRELLECPEVRRAEGVYQNGLPRKWDDKPVFTRLEHGVGVAALLRKSGASLAEQVAGFGHDISHTAFSHTIDLVLGDPTKEDYQDSTHEAYVANSRIPQILRKNGLSENTISDIDKFTLLETTSPSLCADRIDYTLREWAYSRSRIEAQNVASALTNESGQFAFRARSDAIRFWQMYCALSSDRWVSAENMARHHLVAEALKSAMGEGVVTIKDIYRSDDDVVRLMRRAENDETRRAIHCLDHGFFIRDGEMALRTKFRYIDPEFVEHGQLRRLSEVTPGYAGWLKEARQKHDAMPKVSIVPKKPF